jgi:hypothetical protein
MERKSTEAFRIPHHPMDEETRQQWKVSKQVRPQSIQTPVNISLIP